MSDDGSGYQPEAQRLVTRLLQDVSTSQIADAAGLRENTVVAALCGRLMQKKDMAKLHVARRTLASKPINPFDPHPAAFGIADFDDGGRLLAERLQRVAVVRELLRMLPMERWAHYTKIPIEALQAIAEGSSGLDSEITAIEEHARSQGWDGTAENASGPPPRHVPKKEKPLPSVEYALRRQAMWLRYAITGQLDPILAAEWRERA